MKQQIRRGVFETNSSSVHSLTIATVEEYESWKNGELFLDRYGKEFVEVNEKTQKEHDEDYDGVETYDEFWNNYYETFEREFKTPSGDKMIAFGYFGMDG